MINIEEKSEEIFVVLKKYILANSKYNPEVKKVSKNIKYPSVIFEEMTNSLDSVSCDDYQSQEIRNLDFEITIYAVDQGNVNSTIICNELANLVIQIMQRCYRMQGGLDAKLFNINESQATQYTLHFSCKWFMQKNILFSE